MKRFITLLVAVVMLLSCFSLFVSAKNDGILKADRVSAKAGDVITIPVTYQDNPGIYVIRVTVAYDVNVVEYVDINSSASDFFKYFTNPAEGSVIVLMDAKKMQNVTQDIELFSIIFKVKSDAAAGRSLFPVYCEEGMATGLKKENGSLSPVPLSPATSAGAVTVLCSEHTFDAQTSDGSLKCSRCGAVKLSSGDISIEADAGLPEVDVSSGNSSASDTSLEESFAQNSVLQGEDGSDNNGDQGLKAGHFIPIAAAVLVAVLICVGVVVVKKRANSDEPQDW